MRLSRNYKLKASSLMESVIAIAIIAVCLLIASLIYVKLLDSDYEVAYYEAKQKVKELHFETITNQQFEDETYQYDAYKITKTVNDTSIDLKEVNFEIKTKKKVENYTFQVNVINELEY